MRYTIKRECWNEKTFNGYTDNPYWLISNNGCEYGLTDAGKLWSTSNLLITEYTKEMIKNIITECNLNIQLN
jgi:hypothetical protein